MSFDINQLNNLDYEEAESVLYDYLDDLFEKFAQSSEGEDYAQVNPEFGSWISSFTEHAYIQEGFTLPEMTKGEVETIMEEILPRKITLMNREDAQDAIPELIAFWNFLKREYNLRHAGAIVTYLASIKNKFSDWMLDPAKGGIAKNFILSGMKAGFDMTTEEGLNTFQLSYNQQLFGDALAGKILPSSSKSANKKPKTSTKGFGVVDKEKKAKRKKK
jgi:hypothetical protein